MGLLGRADCDWLRAGTGLCRLRAGGKREVASERRSERSVRRGHRIGWLFDAQAPDPRCHCETPRSIPMKANGCERGGIRL